MNAVTDAPANVPTAATRIPVEDRLALDDMCQAYAATLDERRYEDWPMFFMPDAMYRVVPRENHELNLPIALIHCEGHGMMKDRVVALREAVMMRPRSLRRFVTPVRIGSGDGSCDDPLHIRSNVLLVETLHERMTQIVLSGVFHDTVVRDGEGWRFSGRLCIFDSLLLPDSLVEPV